MEAFTDKEIEVLLALVSQANSATAEGKILLGKLQAKLEAMLKPT